MSLSGEPETSAGTSSPDNKRVQVERAGSPVPSCLSVKSDRSMEGTPNLKGESTADARIQQERAGSPVPSYMSAQSDYSMGEPINFRGGFTGDPRAQVERAGSALTSYMSMKSDCSLEHLIDLKGEDCSSDESGAWPGGLACDFCTDREVRAVKFCVTCTASYCEMHVRRHYTVPTLQRHTLVQATGDLDHRLCSQHHRALELFCNTDQMPICSLCLTLAHRGHDVVSSEPGTQRVDEWLERNHPTPASAEGGVTCDFCTEKKVRVVKYCQTCTASCCEKITKQLYTVPAMQSHTQKEITAGLEPGPQQSPTDKKEDCTMQQKSTGGSEKREHVRIVLVGKTGAGKSASGNTILGREEFKSEFSSASVTSQCEKKRGEVDGRELYVIDTPGLYDTNVSNRDVIMEIAKCISLSSPGPHVFLVVIQLDKFTQEEQETVKMIQEIFGEESAKYTMALFTHGDRLKKRTIEEFLSDSKKLVEFTDQCRGRYHVFNNEEKENRSQVKQLLQKIDKMVALNGGGYYTTEMYQKVEAVIEEQKMRNLKETEEKRKREEEELKKQFATEAEEILNKKLEELEKKHEREAREKAERENAFVSKCKRLGGGIGGVGGGITGLISGIIKGAALGAKVGVVAGPVGIMAGALGGAGVGVALNKCTIQ